MRPEDEPSFWRGRRVFITGCTGFVGSWLTLALLESGAQVVGLVRDLAHPSLLRMEGKLELVTAVLGSVEDYPLLERVLNEYEVDSCFHLAAQSIVGAAHRSPLSTFKSNIEGTWNLLEACRRTAGVERVVVASSDKAYGSHQTLPYREDFELRGRHPYDASKSCADLL
ncbi:MAG: GDP-mannose 4,6-dehydratase, partial [Nitrospinota bacterium]